MSKRLEDLRYSCAVMHSARQGLLALAETFAADGYMEYAKRALVDAEELFAEIAMRCLELEKLRQEEMFDELEKRLR